MDLHLSILSVFAVFALGLTLFWFVLFMVVLWGSVMSQSFRQWIMSFKPVMPTIRSGTSVSCFVQMPESFEAAFQKPQICYPTMCHFCSLFNVPLLQSVWPIVSAVQGRREARAAYFRVPDDNAEDQTQL